KAHGFYLLVLGGQAAARAGLAAHLGVKHGDGFAARARRGPHRNDGREAIDLVAQLLVQLAADAGLGRVVAVNHARRDFQQICLGADAELPGQNIVLRGCIEYQRRHGVARLEALALEFLALGRLQ
nr:hypothetical protein [Tanacetum cinerariifolium]